MGVNCSKPSNQVATPTLTAPTDGLIDPFMHQLEQRSIQYTSGGALSQQGQIHLLHKHQRARSSLNSNASSNNSQNAFIKNQPLTHHYPTRLIIRRRTVRSGEEGISGTHIYAIRYPADQPLKREMVPPQQATEQAPQRPLPKSEARPRPAQTSLNTATNSIASASVNATRQQSTQQSHAKILSASSSMSSSKSDDKKETPTLDHLFARETMLSVPKTKSKCESVNRVNLQELHCDYGNMSHLGLTSACTDIAPLFRCSLFSQRLGYCQ
jgi:hypothetical protein